MTTRNAEIVQAACNLHHAIRDAFFGEAQDIFAFFGEAQDIFDNATALTPAIVCSTTTRALEKIVLMNFSLTLNSLSLGFF